MKNVRVFAGISLLFGTLIAQGALATTAPLALTSSLALQDDDEDLEDDLDEDVDDLEEDVGEEEAPKSTKPEEGEVEYGGEKSADSVGGATGFVRQRGFYTTSDLGGFIRFGGFALAPDQCSPVFKPCKPRATSNLQPWIKLGVGYDVLSFDSFQLSTQLSFATGFIANAAPVAEVDSPRDYALAMVNAELIGTYFIERIGISGKVFGGGAFLSPAPLPDASNIGGDVGVGVGVTWATLLTDVTVGVDFNGVAVFGGGVFFTGFSFAPTIKYIF